ncbi:unnamed protein product [Nippostrongylus brasiliensis]|uniref:PID domain-containing protein n=1 Tax=Nippostrongylus brasiliensis TaxID=27835 RepID=A0A0N4Y486_NIPBR|nr:unnamed protein product [Nippostrongylus brasiliensis]
MSWLFQTKIAKSHFYVWYLGSREADGVRGSAVVLPAMRQLLKDSFRKAPNKATVQISSKGLKLIQTVPAMSRSGRVKMQVAKFQIAASCITYSLIGKVPFDDVVGVVMLVLNPEMNSPMHLLISRPEIQRSIVDLEQRLFLAGLLVPRPKPLPRSSSHTLFPSNKHEFDQPVAQTRTRVFHEEPPKRDVSVKLEKTRSQMPRRVVEELKTNRGVSNTFSYGINTTPQYRLFGDTLLRGGAKSRSLENLADSIVSTDMRGGDSSSYRSRMDLPMHGATADGLWRPTVHRVASIRMNL